MKQNISLIVSLLLLLSVVGCSAPEEVAPELMEPVGVQLDSEVVKLGEIYQLSVYEGQILPYVQQLSFQTGGTLEEINVTLGETVTKGQLLATLGVNALTEQIETLQAQIDHEETLGSYNDRIAQAQIDIQKIELEQMKANGATETQCRLKALDIEKAQMELTHQQDARKLDLEGNRDKVAQLRKKLDLGKMTAPFAGRVVYIGFEKGDSVRGYTTVICLADDSRTVLQTPYLSEQAFDHAAKVFVKVGDNTYDVEYIPHDQTEYYSKLMAEQKVYASFNIKAENAGIESGMYAALMVYETYKENVLTVPINALYRDGSIRYVYKLVENQRIRCDVTVGTMTDTNAEITAGLEAGDVVYVKN